MSAPFSRILVLVVALLLARSAGATTSNCAGAADGTACASGCIALGQCTAGACVPTLLRPDGTACSSESPCTFDDHCLLGVCTPGTAVVCPDAPPCGVGYCSPTIGCALSNVCLPDGGVVAGDAGVSQDLGVPADLSLEPNDMCHIPPGAEFYVCEGDDGFYYLPFDAAGSPDGGQGFHVRGSHVADCAFGGARPGQGALALVSLCLLLLWQRQRMAPGRRQR